jgi:signal transduction histidine kinase
VPASAHQRIFRLFQTAGTQQGGNAGVGLAVCRRLCDAHDASITVRSGPGRGATFVVDWPLNARRDALDE